MALTGCWLWASSASAVVEAKLRHNLRAAFASSICNKSFPDHPLEIWKLGIFEAQIVGKSYEPFKGKKLSRHFLTAQSKSLSKKHHHQSRIWGLCDDGTGWVGSWPSPEPLQLKDSGKVSIPFSALKNSCKEFRIDYAAVSGGQPKQLAPASLQPATTSDVLDLDTSGLARGTLAVTCYPQEPAWQGPVMWYFAPVKDGPTTNVPQASSLYGQKDVSKNIATWINAVRAQEGLAALKPDDKILTQQARHLTSRPDLTHDRRELTSVANSLKTGNKTFLGENRFKGQSNLEIGWLLWNSPRHRALILSKDATHMGVSIRRHGNNRFGVVIVAR